MTTAAKNSTLIGRPCTVAVTFAAVMSCFAASSADALDPPKTYAEAQSRNLAAASVADQVRTMTAQYNAGQYVQAGHTGQRILVADPTNLSAHYLMGNIFLQAEVLDAAANEYEYCLQHGLGTREAEYAKKALDQMNGTPTVGAPTTQIQGGQFGQPAQQATSEQNGGTTPNTTFNKSNFVNPLAIPVTGQPARIDLQSAERRDNALRTGAGLIDAKRRTLDAEVKHINDDAALDAKQVPRSFSVGGHRVPNYDYDKQVQVIRDNAAAEIQVLQVDFQNEQAKVANFYRGMADSYAQAGINARSQMNYSRSPYVVDHSLDMYVHNVNTGNPLWQNYATTPTVQTSQKKPAQQ